MKKDFRVCPRIKRFIEILDDVMHDGLCSHMCISVHRYTGWLQEVYIYPCYDYVAFTRLEMSQIIEAARLCRLDVMFMTKSNLPIIKVLDFNRY